MKYGDINGLRDAFCRVMNLRMICLMAMVALLATFATGCCTTELVYTAEYTTHDKLNPSAVYQTTNHDSFALEGTRFNDDSERGVNNSNHVFVLAPKANIKPLDLRTNDNLSINDINSLDSAYTKNLNTKKQLPANYQKVADLPTNNVSIVIKDRHPKRAMLVFLPVTVAVDAATSPLQIICLGLLWWSLGRGDNC